MASKLIKDMMGLRFERLLVIRRAPSDSNGNARWHCICDCGNRTISSGFTLRNGEAKSCGCHSTDILRKNATTHGLTRTPEWMSWSDMKSRCLNPNNVRFEHYGGRGIKVCKQWINSFETFLADIGQKPTKEYTIERIDNDGNYEPKNCRWATLQEQNNNTSRQVWVVYKGKKMSLSQAINLSNTKISHDTVRHRVGRGWPFEKAISVKRHGARRGAYNKKS